MSERIDGRHGSEAANCHSAAKRSRRLRMPRPAPETTTAPDAAALDLLLTEAGQSTVARFLPGLEAVRLAGGLARRPRAVLHRGSTLVRELVTITVGRSQRQPEPDGSPLPRSGMVGEPALSPDAAEPTSLRARPSRA